MKRVLVAAVTLLAAAAFSYGQEYHNIETVCFLMKDGQAYVMQKWDMTVSSGTEMYIPIDNPGNSYIHDFKVEEDGIKFESDGRHWDSDRSLREKTHRSGIVEKGGGSIELCWGQGEYGHHVYYISYLIDNLVQDYGDRDGFHWHFLNDEWSSPPEHAKIYVVNKTDTPWYWESADSSNVRFWGFGMVGDSSIEDGKLVFESTEPLQYRSFFSLLCEFDKGIFSPKTKGRESWEELREQAMKGSDYGKEKRDAFEWFAIVIMVILFVVIPALVVLFLIYYVLERLYWRITGKRFEPKVFGKNKITEWSRDVPLEGNPTAFFSLLQEGDRLHKDHKKQFSNLVSAYFLKWIQEGWVKVEKDPKNDKRVNLRFVDDPDRVIADETEQKVYEGAREAAGDELLEANEFKRWSYRHDTQVASWPNYALQLGRKVWKAASQEQRCQAVAFKNFLEDFTLVDEREAPEVGVWKQYLQLAAVLGIADKVMKNFEKLFPKVMEEYNRQTNMMDTMTTYYILDSINRSSRSMMASAIDRQNERAAAKAAAQRRSSGGGGSISFGGGGGGYGGGHGGGSR